MIGLAQSIGDASGIHVAWIRGVQDPERAAQVREAVREIFATPGMRKGLQPDSFEERMNAWIAEAFRWAGRLLSDLDQVRIEHGIVFWCSVAVLGITVLLLAWHILRTTRGSLRSRRNAALQGQRASSLEQRKKDSAALRQYARDLASQGEYREAARHLLLAVLALLEEKEIVHVAQGWTNREILRRVADKHGHQESVLAFESSLERTSYGGQDLNAEELGTIETLFDEIWATLRGRTA